MFKDKMRCLGEFIMKNNKIVFPAAGVLVVAVVVCAVLSAVGNRRVEDFTPELVPTTENTADVSGDVPLKTNEDDKINELIFAYYNAQALGDLETLRSLCDEISDLDALSFEEKANYIEYYPALEIYTKEGMNEGETIAYVYYRMTFVNHEEEFPGYTAHYVCTAEDGSLYIKRANFSDELNEYISKVCAQDDVVELNNRVVAEYDAFKETYPELATYSDEVMSQVNLTVGVRWAEMQSAAADAENTGDEQTADVTGNEAGQGSETMYAVTKDTVNVRSSDSMEADRIGKAPEGTRLQVLEIRPNGWSKVLFEKKEGFVSSEYLQMEETAETGNADNAETVGTVTALTNVNVRASASQSSEKLGKLVAGDSVEVIAQEGEWYKVRFGDKTGYVNSEYVQ